MTIVKRFISGARCPQCHEVDKIRCWREDGLYRSECVNCAYSDAMDETGKKIETLKVIKFPPSE